MRTLFLLLFFSFSVLAQQRIEFFPGGSYDPTVPTPPSVLGYEIGERFTDYRSLERYVEKLSPSSNRIRRVVYGESVERRPLQALIISSPSNLSRLEEWKAANKKLTDPRLFRSKTEVDALLKDLPAIVYLSYGVHGNESSSTEAAIQVAYQLCAGTDQRTTSILENTIVILDPAVNPDGRERYVQWFNGAVGANVNTNPDAVEHSEPWPGGRTNHFYFDLNRDLSWMTQQETRARVAFYREWMPHVHVDYHEMGYTSTYFFFPAAAPFHEVLPEQVEKWGTIYGKGNAEAFDELGIAYYVGEDFDMFYPGYGDSWPTFNGAIGMTYEQAGSGRAGLGIRKPGDGILTLRERARNHFVTSLATLETTVKNRVERLRDFSAFWETGVRGGGTVKGYLLREGNDPNRTAKLVSILLRQGIEVHRVNEPVRVQATRFFGKRSVSEAFPKGTYLVPLNQPQRRLAQALLEPETVARDTFFYDVSAWSLPVAYGVTGYSLEGALPPASRITEIPPLNKGITGGRARYAYLIPWERSGATKLVWQLLEREYRLSVAARTFEVNGRVFGPGTIIVNLGSNPGSLHEDLQALSEAHGVEVFAAHSGLTEKGISLGSNHVRPVKKPAIVLVTGAPVFANDFGELWYLFEQELGIPITSIRASELADANLSKYDVIILPDGGNYQSIFDSSRVDRLKRWVQSGGVLIGIENGARFLTKSRSGITQATLKSEKKEDEKSKEEKELDKAKKDSRKRLTSFEQDESDRLARIPGTIFKALVDTTHPIGYGYARELFVLKGNAEPFELPENGRNVVRFTGDSVQVSGYVSPEKSKKVADSGYAMEFQVGQGKAVLFAETVSFRMFWDSLPKLLLNAVLFLPQAR